MRAARSGSWRGHIAGVGRKEVALLLAESAPETVGAVDDDGNPLLDTTVRFEKKLVDADLSLRSPPTS